MVGFTRVIIVEMSGIVNGGMNDVNSFYEVIYCTLRVRREGRGRFNRGALSLSHITQRYVRRVKDRA